jgi:hypothetical protein
MLHRLGQDNRLCDFLDGSFHLTGAGIIPLHIHHIQGVGFLRDLIQVIGNTVQLPASWKNSPGAERPAAPRRRSDGADTLHGKGRCGGLSYPVPRLPYGSARIECGHFFSSFVFFLLSVQAVNLQQAHKDNAEQRADEEANRKKQCVVHNQISPFQLGVSGASP